MYAVKNKVQLIGHLGNVPDVRTTEKGKKWARFSVATNEKFRNAQGERVTETQWHYVVVWGTLAEVAENFLYKGKEVLVEGRIVSRSYVDKEGVRRYVTEIVAGGILLLGSRANG
jgi:single-strand DNA-binding protein